MAGALAPVMIAAARREAVSYPCPRLGITPERRRSMILNIDDLDPVQQAALQQRHESLLLIGGAASGKSSLLAYRMKQALEELPAGPEPVLALTVTRRARDTLQRLVGELIPDAEWRVQISTVEDFCVKLLREEGRAIGIDPNFYHCSHAGNCREVLGAAVRSLRDQPYLDRDREIEMIAEVLVAGRKTYLEDLEQWEWLRDLMLIRQPLINLYAFRQWEHQMFDFVGLQVWVERLLMQAPAVARALRQRYPHVFIDDLHEASRDMVGVLRAWAGTQELRMDIAIDDDRSPFIYHPLSEPLLSNLVRSLGMRRLYLDANYRSPAAAVALGNALLGHRAGRVPSRPPMRAVRSDPEESAVRAFHFATGEDEARWIAQDIARRPTHEWAQCAVILPSAELRRAITAALEGFDSDIPVWTPRGVEQEPLALRNVVQLRSLEAASGEVFRHVYMPGLVEGVLPACPPFPIDDGRLETDGDRRLLYSAMMGAEESLTLTSAGRYESLSSTGQLWHRTAVPSRFLYEMGILDMPISTPSHATERDER
jgi:superfamily I DNA/RNA helicase